ncbi:hypothetical protein BKA62DRAFT_777197 [Auriculariales sp. MPI-PUGE-AT-0066]|nr:hypothetical protein BKA62DRAFT_777197 [Auriculariales sp. MPI-PUGE-AT-0066]
MQRQHDGDRREFERKLFEEQDGKKTVECRSIECQVPDEDGCGGSAAKTEVQKKLEQAKTEIATLRRSRHPGRQETEDLRRKLDEENRSKQEMNEALSRAEAQLVASRNEAAALRLFSDEENVDGATVHNHFKDLVTGIDDLVFSVYEKLGEVEVSSPIDIDRNKFGAFAATNPDIANMLWPFLSTIMSTQPTMETVAMPVMHCIASSFLCSYFLQPFYPIAAEFSDPSLYDGLTRLWSGIAERESQEVIGRWRSISYRALRNPQADEDVFFENGAKYLLNYLCHTMVILLPQHLAGSQNWETLVDSLMPRAVKVLRKAVAFQSITQGICVTWDYAIYHPALRGTFLEDTMEVDVDVQGDHPKLLERQPINGSQLLLATSLGLQAHRKTVQSQETIVVQKARVVVLRASKP